ILAAFIFIETPFGQNWLARQVTAKLSRELKTKITFKHVGFSLLNKVNMEGFLLLDRNNDTLLYAGRLQVRITDWFIFKKNVELKYVGLENAVVKMQRADSTWNYQFVVDYFSPSSANSRIDTASGGVSLNLQKLSLKNVYFLQKDAWSGQDMVASVGEMQLDARRLDLDSNVGDINSILLVKPSFSLRSYNGKRQLLSTSTSAAVKDSSVAGSAGGWLMKIARLRIVDGTFEQLQEGASAITGAAFDPSNLRISSINGNFQNVRLDHDTLNTRVEGLAARERSGLVLKSLTTDLHITPQGMDFDRMRLVTNRSVIANRFSMHYHSMDDLNDFLHKVALEADFANSEISSDDVAFFAPEVASWKKNIQISGIVKGTIADISGRKLVINAGNNTYVNGDITLSGLPDIGQTFIDFKSNDTRTNYNDIVRFAPQVGRITDPDLAGLGNIHFTGSFTGFLHDFVTFGTIQTNLGTITSDLNMKLPAGKEPIYSGNIATTNFQLGRFLHNSDVGVISLSGLIKGHGATATTIGADLKAKVTRFDFKGYTYHNITANGTLEKKLFNGFASIEDSNLHATLNGLLNINGPNSRFDMVANVQTARLQPLHFTKDDIRFAGKLDFNFTGDNIDNFLGTARITDASLVRNNQRLSFDSMILHSDLSKDIRTLTVSSNEFDGSLTGDFHIGDL
ncbi:MAG TPA: hypothetical protein VGC95_13475, partial [Chitinophagaceae bacterium]